MNDAEDINIEEIMNNIRADIELQKPSMPPLSFEDGAAVEVKAAPGSLDEAIEYLSCYYEVQPYQMLTGNKVKVFVKKVIRKLIAFVILPIVRQQNTMNYYSYIAASYVKKQEEEIEALRKRVEELENLKK